VLAFLGEVVKLAAKETWRGSAPYTPGVTGVAMTMNDHRRLLDPSVRAQIHGGDELLKALAAASAFNVLSIELDQSSKGQQVAVIYLNRLLLPRYDLPLGRGGFRERSVEQLAAWVVGSQAPPQPSLA
jgi:hypothetical protein